MMRTFFERRAEIFRRAECRIEERCRIRKRILSVCLPLCLVLTVGVIASYQMTFGRHTNESCESAYYDGDKESLHCSFFTAEIENVDRDAGCCRVISEKLTVDAVYDVIMELFSGKSETAEETSGTCTSENDGYRITLMTKDGVRYTYYLNRRQLYDTEQNRGILITEKEYQRLILILLPETGEERNYG